MDVSTPELIFLHQQVHAEDFGSIHGLRELPFVLYPAVAKVMCDYAACQRIKQVNDAGADGGLEDGIAGLR